MYIFLLLYSMKTEVNPKDTARAEAFEMWMTSPMPMVTLTKTFDVNHLLKASRKSGIKFNALLCWCIGKAATQVCKFAGELKVQHGYVITFILTLGLLAVFSFPVSAQTRRDFTFRPQSALRM